MIKKIFIALSVVFSVLAFGSTSRIANAQVIDQDDFDVTNFLNGKKFDVDIDNIDFLSFVSEMPNGSGAKFATITIYSNDPYDRGPFTYDVYVGKQPDYVMTYSGGGFFTITTYSGGGVFSTRSIDLTGDKTMTIEFSNQLNNFDVTYDYIFSELLQVLSLYVDTSIEDALNQILENPNYYGLYTEQQLEQEKNTSYQLGYQSALENDDSLYDMILAVVDTPFRVFDNIFDFEVLGINIKNIVLSFATIAIAIFVIKRFI